MRVRIPLLLPSALAMDAGTAALLDAGILVCIVLVTLTCSYSFLLALLAQWTEHRASIPLVEGSNPSGRTTFHSSSMAESSAVNRVVVGSSPTCGATSTISAVW